MKTATVKKAGHFDVEKLRQLNILLIEDDLLNRRLMSILFSQHGMKLQMAENGIEGVEKVKAGHFDIVLMDMEMPLMNGYQATTIIRQELKNTIPIIAMTAHSQAGEREKCLLFGMNDHIAKPVDEDMLFSAIHKLTGLRKPFVAKTGIIRSISPAIPVDKVCNMEYLNNATRGNEKMINSIVRTFFEQAPGELSTLAEAIKKNNYPVISGIAHKLRSSFAILGIGLLEPVFEEMEQLGNSASGIERIISLKGKVNAVFEQAMEEMNMEPADNSYY